MNKTITCLLATLLTLTHALAQTDADGVRTWDGGGRMQADICVYGATSGGITAALTAKRMGKSVILIEPSQRIGGLTAGGLGKTDVGRVEIIQGLAMDFYRRVGTIYGKADAVFDFEPKVALAAFEQMLREDNLPVQMERRVIKVKKKGNRLREIVLEDASQRHRQHLCIEAHEFIDCSYEGDLMARAGVSYTVGREPNSQYGETHTGMQMLDKHQVPDGVDPYREKGNPESGLLWGIMEGDMGQTGQGDKRVQAYNFRITMTNDPHNRIPITRPENYDSTRYELLVRWKETDPWRSDKLRDCFAWDLMTNPTKTDINNNKAFSTDMIGYSWDYPEASYKQRERIFKEHLDYTKGLLWFVASDPRVPAFVRRQIGEWGYPKDEYPESDHFTPQLYIRESRRMIGRYVMTQANCQHEAVANDPVGWAAYTMDSHNCGRADLPAQRKIQHQLPQHHTAGTRSREPAGAILPVGLTHRLWQHTHGACVHGAGTVGSHSRRAGHRQARGLRAEGEQPGSDGEIRFDNRKMRLKEEENGVIRHHKSHIVLTL